MLEWEEHSVRKIHFTAKTSHFLATNRNITSFHDILKCLSYTTCDVLAVIFYKIFDSKELPSNWSTALIVPTLKSGAPSLANNYRGISLLTSSYKLLTSTAARRIEL